MKKILITRRLLRTCEEKASKTFDAKLNSNDELYSQTRLIELSQRCDGILSSISDKIDKENNFATPSALGLLTRKAIYREGLGAVLTLDKSDERTSYLVPKRLKVNNVTPFPFSDALVI